MIVTWIGLRHDDVGSDESQGQAWRGLGTAATATPSQWMREAGADAFVTCTTFDSPFLRANSYAVLGAVEFLRSAPSHQAARALLERASGVLADAATTTIPWPESPATPDNARIPDVLMGAPVLSSPEKERRAAAEAVVATLPAAATHG